MLLRCRCRRRRRLRLLAQALQALLLNHFAGALPLAGAHPPAAGKCGVAVGASRGSACQARARKRRSASVILHSHSCRCPAGQGLRCAGHGAQLCRRGQGRPFDAAGGGPARSDRRTQLCKRAAGAGAGAAAASVFHVPCPHPCSACNPLQAVWSWWRLTCWAGRPPLCPPSAAAATSSTAPHPSSLTRQTRRWAGVADHSNRQGCAALSGGGQQ